MAYEIKITHNDLIDALEEKLGDVYENIEEGDKVEEMRFEGRGYIIITIGKEA